MRNKLTAKEKYDMLNVWINMWITDTSLCITCGYPMVQKEYETPFTIRKITPFLILSKARSSTGFFNLARSAFVEIRISTRLL